MISVATAKQIIREHASALPPKDILLLNAAGLVLAEDVFAGIMLPGFEQSSMDGYAFSFDDWQQQNKLPLTGMVAAGSKQPSQLQPGTAVRIFTGAPLPNGANTVVMQEKTTVQNGVLTIADPQLQCGANVRPAGADIRVGEQALQKGHTLTPAAIGFLTALGVLQVKVYPLPVVSIIVTGDELQQTGMPLQYGQVYESNAAMLQAALHALQINTVSVYHVEDAPDAVTNILQVALEKSDVVLLTGGISVGDFDFVLQATVRNGVEQLFHKIKQRPAKPLYFGKKDSKYVFGLPGNPVSGLVSFYEYTVPLLGLLSKRPNALQTLMVPLEQDFQKPAGLTHFLKGWFNGKTVAVLSGQESYRMHSFAKANCLIQVDEAATHCLANMPVEIHLLPD